CRGRNLAGGLSVSSWLRSGLVPPCGTAQLSPPFQRWVGSSERAGVPRGRHKLQVPRLRPPRRPRLGMTPENINSPQVCDEAFPAHRMLLACGTRPISVGGRRELSCCGERDSSFWLPCWRPEGLPCGGIAIRVRLNTRLRNSATQ